MGDTVRLDGRLGGRDEVRAYQRVEVITGRQRRRRWTAAEKARIVAQSAVPGANVSEVARRCGVNRGLLTVWRRQARIVPEEETADGGAPLFVPVTVDPDPPVTGDRAQCRPEAGAPAPARIELDLHTGRLVLCGAVDPGLAAAVIAAVRGRE